MRLTWVGVFFASALALFFVWAIYVDWPELKVTLPPFLFQSKDVVLAGYYPKGCLKWQVVARKALAVSSRDYLQVQSVESGGVYDVDGYFILRNIRSLSMAVIQCSGAGSGVFDRLVATSFRGELLEKSTTESSATELNCGVLTWEGDLASLSNGVKFIQKSRAVFTSGNVVIALQTRDVTFSERVFIQTPTVSIQADLMHIEGGTRISHLWGGVIWKKRPDPMKWKGCFDDREWLFRLRELIVNADSLTHSYVPTGECVVLEGRVRATQGGYRLRADRVIYGFPKQFYVAEGHVNFELPNLEEVLNKSWKKKNKTVEWAQTLSSRVGISCDRMSLDQTLKQWTCEGHVVLTQPHQVIHADQMKYDDFSGILSLVGHVKWNRPGHFSFGARRVSVNVETEEVEASEAIQTQFR